MQRFTNFLTEYPFSPQGDIEASGSTPWKALNNSVLQLGILVAQTAPVTKEGNCQVQFNFNHR